MAELQIRGLTKRFGGVRALDGIELDVAAGEFFVILGPSAAGKTTTLRSIAGLERPDGLKLELRRESQTGHVPHRMVERRSRGTQR